MRQLVRDCRYTHSHHIFGLKIRRIWTRYDVEEMMYSVGVLYQGMRNRQGLMTITAFGMLIAI